MDVRGAEKGGGLCACVCVCVLAGLGYSRLVRVEVLRLDDLHVEALPQPLEKGPLALHGGKRVTHEEGIGVDVSMEAA